MICIEERIDKQDSIKIKTSTLEKTLSREREDKPQIRTYTYIYKYIQKDCMYIYIYDRHLS